MAHNGASTREELLALETANKLLSQKLLDERVAAVQKARDLSKAQIEIANLKSDLTKVEEERSRLVERIDELEQKALLQVLKFSISSYYLS